MKKIFVLMLSTLMGVLVIFLFSNAVKYPSGSPGGYTGSPGDAKNCTQCHNGSSSTITGVITSNIPSEGYSPGVNYTITVTLTGTGKKGFEVSPQNISGELLGNLVAGTGTHLVNSNKAVTHSVELTSSPAIWTFTWTAPNQGTGSVTFYGAFALSKSVTRLSTMVIGERLSAINEFYASIKDLTIFPNPVHNVLNINYYVRETGNIQIRLIDSNGKMIKEFSDNNSLIGENMKEINIDDNITRGIYFLQVINKDDMVVKKVLIQ